MENRFDTLARSLAGGLSRREALRCLGGFVGGTLIACLGMGKASAKTKKKPPPPPPGPCTVQCKKLQSIARNNTEFDFPTCLAKCTDCGQPQQTYMVTVTTFACCTGTTTYACSGISCTDTTTDNSNCGSCGNRCSAQHFCSNGKCIAHDSCPLVARCPNVPKCGTAAQNAYCVETTEGTKQCVEDPASCSDAPRCNTSKDCPIGEVCVDFRSSCCLTNICGKLAGIGVASAVSPAKGRSLGSRSTAVASRFRSVGRRA
ncbi:MAG TPA: hypothetical protein VG013_06640 [Gemmataceae bacterium]|jgi:hypothetical protein|nr:hypothetical protein [Gemmataceae bacterium]